MTDQITQIAPPADTLERLVAGLTYRPGWSFRLENVDRGQGSAGLTLEIFVRGPDTNDVNRTISVVHYMIVPAASYNEQSWRRWLFEQILLVERHEAMEFFRIDGVQPFAPNHGPGFDPYQLFELTTEIDRRTRYTGEVAAAGGGQ